MKMTQTQKILGTAFFVTLAFFTACKKDYDTVPVKPLPEGSVITIDSLRKIYTAFDTTITGDFSVYGVVTADAVTGNIYKELYIQDETNAIRLELLSSADFFIGDRVRVALRGATIKRDNNMLVLDSIDPDVAIIRQERDQDLTPEIVTIDSLNVLPDGITSKYQGRLVQLENVEFECADACKTWADAIGQNDENRNLIDASGNILVVRSSGYSSFAGDKLPFEKGSLIGVVSQYNGTVQLTIRDPKEFVVSGTRNSACAACPTFSHIKDFDDESITSGGWSQQNVIGNVNWETSSTGQNSPYGKISNYINSSNVPCETWLVSPALDLSGTTNPEFSFSSDFNFSGPILEVYITSNYTGDASTTTWTQLSPILDSNSGWAGPGNFVASGTIGLVNYRVAGTRIAFKYTGGSSDGSTWEIDDIKIIDL